MGSHGTDDNVAIDICSDVDLTDCCRSGGQLSVWRKFSFHNHLNKTSSSQNLYLKSFNLYSIFILNLYVTCAQAVEILPNVSCDQNWGSPFSSVRWLEQWRQGGYFDYFWYIHFLILSKKLLDQLTGLGGWGEVGGTSWLGGGQVDSDQYWRI